MRTRLHPAAVFVVAICAVITLLGCATSGSQVISGGADMTDTDLTGTWRGEIQVSGVAIGIVVRFDSERAGTMDIPEQGASGIPLQDIRHEHPDISFNFPTGPVKAEFEGTFNGDVIEGSFTQGPAKGTFSISRGGGGKEVSAAESDTPAFAAKFGTEEEVILTTAKGDLAGSLLIPSTGTAPFPAVLIIAGSGPTDRNGNYTAAGINGNTLLLIADALAEAGIASLRFDKRGLGGSMAAVIPEKDLRFEDFVNDTAGWLAHLDNDSRTGKIAVVGHSEGALIGLLALSQSRADAYISLAGPGRQIGMILRDQFADYPEKLRTEAIKITESLEKGELVDEVDPQLAAFYRASVQPYIISWMVYDPAVIISQVEMPVLVAHGTSDLQIFEADIQKLVESTPDAEHLIIDGMSHALKQVGNDMALNQRARIDPQIPLDESFIEGLISFLNTNIR